jgi:hypothetical protein
MSAPGAPRGGAGWANEAERWLLFRCRNSQERSSVTVREGPVRQFWQPQVYQPATRVAEPLLAIETSDFDQCLQLVGANHARAAAGMYGAGGYFNSEARFCCRFTADAARRDHRCNSRLLNRTAAGQAARLSGSPAQAGRRSDQVGRESLIGWIGAVRPSRRPPARPPQD